jgi:hypothetical protein
VRLLRNRATTAEGLGKRSEVILSCDSRSSSENRRTCPRVINDACRVIVFGQQECPTADAVALGSPAKFPPG